jgi:hypothetical protein
MATKDKNRISCEKYRRDQRREKNKLIKLMRHIKKFRDNWNGNVPKDVQKAQDTLIAVLPGHITKTIINM